MEQSFFKYELRPNFSINNYFVGKSNIEAFNLLINSKNINNLFLIGPSKSGKTHLAFIWQNKFNAIIYDNTNFKKILENKFNVIIDNIFNNINEEEIFHIINHCSSVNCKILVTSNMKLNEYAFHLNDLSSRLKTFININIDLPDDELLVNLMTKLFHDKQIIIKNPEIFHYIIKRVHRSYDKIFHLIDKIDNLLMKKNKQLTIPIIKELI
ncbi:MAG: HdaA/DnaA family protein [Alphaproteobacteria bacterium]